MNWFDEHSAFSLNTLHGIIYTAQSDTAFGGFPSFRKVCQGESSGTLVELGGGKGVSPLTFLACLHRYWGLNYSTMLEM